MNRSIKLTTLALAIASATANAALYRVVEVEVASDVAATISGQYGENTPFEARGVAIQPSALGENCFQTSCADDSYAAAVETRIAIPGFNYREEVAFNNDVTFYDFLDEDHVEQYCLNELGYATCDVWADIRWNTWVSELRGSSYLNPSEDVGSFHSNSLAFVEGFPSAYVNEYNNVINSLTIDGKAVGNQSVADLNTRELTTRNTVVAPVLPTPGADAEAFFQTRAWKADGTYTVGSISREQKNDNTDETTTYISRGAIWGEDGVVAELPWGASVGAEDDDRLSQGSLRDFIVSEDGSTIYSVGYNTFRLDGNNYLNAAVMKGSLPAANSLTDVAWVFEIINNTKSLDNDDDFVYSNSRLDSVNQNLVAVGSAKRAGRVTQDGASPNRLFVVDNIAFDAPEDVTLNARFFSEFGGIFFPSSGGEIGGINNYNEIVGTADTDDVREVDGKPRPQGGFIFPYQSNACSEDPTNEACDRNEIFDGKAWLLDDLTNGGEFSADNNQFRIIEASDINDAGVISATAVMCEGGYDSTASNALCQEGRSNAEKVVAVKLIPIQGATSENIVVRSVDNTRSERKGAGLGWLAFGLLALLGLRRR
ncbi:DUF3466 family protein [Vibrio sp. SM6]|uniref:DUF3466 family protein n=1 Tax=Vibrio agarilyticus TaxID=2726741 RepID=A0A7X8TPT8_9VIBR|nr:DUF3466 family protein [Vibrio agarilyticus]NLS12559.1 DUF3466 family protein [Vibrio agarilyticus]